MGAVWLVAACTYENPAYKSGNDTGPAATGSESSGTGSDDMSTTIGETEAPQGLCDLYSINEQGQLRIIDVDTGSSRVMLEEPPLDSWSIATHRGSGEIFVSSRDMPTELFTIDPVTAEYSRRTIMIDALDRVGRATFHGGNLWLGTDQDSRFVAIEPGSFAVVDDDTYETGEGGDMVFIDQDHALIVNLLGSVRVYDFVTGLEKQVLLSNAVGGVSGLAYDDEGRLWASTMGGDSQLYRITVADNGDDTYDVTVGSQLDLDGSFRITDLATVVTPSDDC